MKYMMILPDSTIGRQISRAKQTIRTSVIAFRLPDACERAERLESVLHVLYLVFNEGYTTSAGDTLHRVDSSNEAMRLVREMHNLMPHHGAVARRTGSRSLDQQAIVEECRSRVPHSRWAPSANINCRWPSPPCTTKHHAPKTPTGHRSSRCTRG